MVKLSFLLIKCKIFGLRQPLDSFVNSFRVLVLLAQLHQAVRVQNVSLNVHIIQLYCLDGVLIRLLELLEYFVAFPSIEVKRGIRIIDRLYLIRIEI